jgi:5-hydroxyisourate hydrolase
MSARTDADGRARLLESGDMVAGDYRLTFQVGPYLAERAGDAFYPVVAVHIRVRREDEHYHVPLLLSPFGYSTYRGS